MCLTVDALRGCVAYGLTGRKGCLAAVEAALSLRPGELVSLRRI